MSGVRVLVGTEKCAFVLTSDGKRQRWGLSSPHFVGWEIYHLDAMNAVANLGVRVRDVLGLESAVNGTPLLARHRRYGTRLQP
jgi:hypothetical protein